MGLYPFQWEMSGGPRDAELRSAALSLLAAQKLSESSSFFWLFTQGYLMIFLFILGFLPLFPLSR